MPIIKLTCSCCGENAGVFEQWWNRDTGWGHCRRCIDAEIARGTPADEILSCYGVEGVNYQARPCPTCKEPMVYDKGSMGTHEEPEEAPAICCHGCGETFTL